MSGLSETAMTHTTFRTQRHAAALIGGLLLTGNAFAIDRDSAQRELSQAMGSVQTAERDDASRYAPSDLDEAHAMLDSARTADDARSWDDVAIYAERAKVAGDLASARARQHRAEAATSEIERSVDALRANMSTSGGAP
jgi:hypothetical protein